MPAGQPCAGAFEAAEDRVGRGQSAGRCRVSWRAGVGVSCPATYVQGLDGEAVAKPFGSLSRQVGGAGCLHRLDAVLDLRVLALERLPLGDVLMSLSSWSVGDEALEAAAVQVGERELRAGVRPLARADQAGVLD